MRTTAPVAPARPADHPLLHRGDVLAIALGAALLSCTSIFVVLAQVAPGVSAFYRVLFGGTALFGWVVLHGRWQPIRGRDAALALLPAIGLAADLILWHRSILWVGPGVATLLTNFQVFLLAVVGVLAYRERLALGLLGQVVAWLMIGRAMPRLPASLVGLLILLQPALALVVDVLLFGRPTSAMDWCGLLLALAGILLGALRRRRPLPPPVSG